MRDLAELLENWRLSSWVKLDGSMCSDKLEFARLESLLTFCSFLLLFLVTDGLLNFGTDSDW